MKLFIKSQIIVLRNNKRPIVKQIIYLQMYQLMKLIRFTKKRLFGSFMFSQKTGDKRKNQQIREKQSYIPYEPGNKIRIVFLFQLASLWNSWKTVYEAFTNMKDVECIIVLVPRTYKFFVL